MRRLVLVAAAAAMFVGFGTVSSSANGITWIIDPEIGTDSSTCGGPFVSGTQPSQGPNGHNRRQAPVNR